LWWKLLLEEALFSHAEVPMTLMNGKIVSVGQDFCQRTL